MKTKFFFLVTTIFLSLSVHANSYTEDQIFNLYNKAKSNGDISRYELNQIIHAARNPYAPTKSHAGGKFLEALSWYNDITVGNRNGEFSLIELRSAFEKQLEQYLTILFQEKSATERMSSWKMLQKLRILKKIILENGKTYYPYNDKKLSTISSNDTWNRRNTISSRSDFYRRVIDASWTRPVLVKFGLTYCVHCLLMENLGSVPALSRKYKEKLDVYKLWWNPKNPGRYYELNQIASEQKVGSSPIFNLYINGRLIKSEYAFPDEDGSGLEEFLKGYL